MLGWTQKLFQSPGGKAEELAVSSPAIAWRHAGPGARAAAAIPLQGVRGAWAQPVAHDMMAAHPHVFGAGKHMKEATKTWVES